MARRTVIVAAVAVIVTISAGCETRRDGSGQGAADAPYEPIWGAQATDLFDQMDDLLDARDVFGVAGFFAGGGVLDLTAWGGPIATSPGQAAVALRDVWFLRDPSSDPTRVDVDAVYLIDDGAVVRWHAGDRTTGEAWVQRYSFGEGSRIASTVFAAQGVVPEPMLAEAEQLAARHVAFWSASPTVPFDAVYDDDVRIRDGSTGRVLVGRDDVVAAVAGSPPLGLDPSPAVFVHGTGRRSQVIVGVHLGGECPMREVRHWVLVDGRIVAETRYPEVASVRRCVADPPIGWWVGFRPQPVVERMVTRTVEIAGGPVELVNAEPAHQAFVQSLFTSYADAGLGRPGVAAFRFPPSEECVERAGRTTEADEEYGGATTVALCFRAAELYPPDGTAGWSVVASTYGLHELAHVWMLDHLEEDARSTFMRRSGLAEWYADDVDWHRRGVEHAASTIAWGVAGAERARYLVVPAPECAELATRFRLLTGIDPVTSCAPGG